LTYTAIVSPALGYRSPDGLRLTGYGATRRLIRNWAPMAVIMAM
jgi:hypothetical protein